MRTVNRFGRLFFLAQSARTAIEPETKQNNDKSIAGARTWVKFEDRTGFQTTLIESHSKNGRLRFLLHWSD